MDAHVYCESGPSTWEDSEMRVWLNDSFFNTAFSRSEQRQIEPYAATADANPYYDTEQGSDTLDYVWLLSAQEVQKYLPDKSGRHAQATVYAYSVYRFAYPDNVEWALRTAANLPQNHAIVNFSGSLFEIEGNYQSAAVRPAIKVRLDVYKENQQ